MRKFDCRDAKHEDGQTWDAGESKEFYSAVFGWEYFEPDSGYIFIINRGRRAVLPNSKG